MTETLNIAGCGRVGRTLGRLWHQSGRFRIGCVWNRSRESALRACAFIGAGRGVESARDLSPAADFLLIATRDEAIEETALELASAAPLREQACAFHVSGALSSRVLEPLKARGLHTASVHPVASFADPEGACRDFAGSYCGSEGDAEALTRIEPAFEAIGARLFRIDADQKTLYHAGAVMACNYLVTLVEAGLRCFERAGVAREVALRVLEPLVSNTARNVFRHDPAQALSGPIARGEVAVVRNQLPALDALDPELGEIYRALGGLALQLAAEQASARPADLESIRRELSK